MVRDQHTFGKLRFKSQHRGVALISILLILAVLATLAIYTAEDQSLAIRRVENIGLAEQGYQVNLSGEQWVVKVLEKDMIDDQLNSNEASSIIDHRGEIWGNLGPPVEVGDTGTLLLMTVDDLQGRLNINNLVEGKQRDQNQQNQEQQSPDESNNNGDGEENNTENDPDEEEEEPAYWYQIFQNLLVSLELNPELVDPMIDWVDNDENPIGTTGAEDFFYTGLETPYRSANRGVASVSEIVNIRDFDRQAIAALLPWVSALPVASSESLVPVNVNTASARVLALFSADQPADPTMLEPLILRRNSVPFQSLDEFREQFLALIPGDLVPGYEDMLSVNSSFYAGHSCAESGRVKFSMFSLMQKLTPENNVKVLQRERFFGCPAFGATEIENSEPG